MDLALATAVAPATMAVERTLPVLPALETLLPEGLVRGRTVACDGLTAPALGLSLAVQACREGAWLAVVDLPWLGVEATVEAGVPVERVVRIDTRPDGDEADLDDGDTGRGRSGNAGSAARARAADDDRWAEVLGAVVDGFDLILTKVPTDLPAGLVRRLQTRIRSRGVVLLTVGRPGPMSADVTVTATDVRWAGIHQGHGHLQARRVTAQVAGRRVPRTRQADLWLPAVGGGIDAAVTEPTTLRPRARSGPVLDRLGPGHPVPAGPGLLPAG